MSDIAMGKRRLVPRWQALGVFVPVLVFVVGAIYPAMSLSLPKPPASVLLQARIANGGLAAGGGIAADARFVAYRIFGGRIFVWDGDTGLIRALPTQEGCEPVSLHERRMLVNCASDDGRVLAPHLMSVFGRPAARIRGWRPGERYLAIGTYWLRGEYVTCHEPSCRVTLYLNWRTGRRVADPTDPNRNLNSRLLRGSPAAPKVRVPDAYGIVTYSHRALVYDDGRRLSLYRPHHEPLALGKSIGGCCLDGIRRGDPILGRHVVTWGLGGVAYAVNIDTGRGRRMVFASDSDIKTAVVGGRVFVAVGAKGVEAGPRGYSLVSFRAP